MTDKLFRELCDTKVLKRAWHLARVDARNYFMFDPFEYSDFAFDLDQNLALICQGLENGSYHPRPLLRIDVPKDTYSARPGSLIDISDLIVLYGMAILIVPKLDKQLPDTVYSYRYRPDSKRKTLFKDEELVQYKFLKKKTIRMRIDIFDPWYEKWPMFIQKSMYTYEEEKFNYLSVSDISAYFENISLDILRELLLKYFPRDQKIINLLISILEHWTWPTKHLRTIKRGIPQGNSISSFLGNIYLLPLDEALQDFSKRFKLRVFRYMDDVKIFSTKRQTAIKAIFCMNDALRELQLNIQGAKTAILERAEIRKELFDDRMIRINPLILELQKGKLLKERREEIRDTLIDEVDKLDQGNRLRGLDLRLFRRIITGFSLLADDRLVDSVLRQIRLNPDAMLTRSAVNYLRLFPNEPKVSAGILDFLRSAVNLFDFQEAWFLTVLRYSYTNTIKISDYARRTVEKKGRHFHVRCQAVNVLANSVIHKRSFEKIVRMYESEGEPEVKRALTKLLCQLDSELQNKCLLDGLYSPNYRISSLCKMLLTLRFRKQRALEELSYIFRDFSEYKLADNFYKLGVIRYNSDKDVLRILRDSLRDIGPLQSKYLQIKRRAILSHISQEQMKLG